MNDEEPKIGVPREQRAGVWANHARVNRSSHEFTLDFIQLEPFGPGGIVVACVCCSSLFVMDFLDDLGRLWQDWARKAMPPEVKGDDGQETA